MKYVYVIFYYISILFITFNLYGCYDRKIKILEVKFEIKSK